MNSLAFGEKRHQFTTSLVSKIATFIISLRQYACCDGLIQRAVFSCVARWNLHLVLLPNQFVIYLQVFLTFIASKSLKLPFTLNCVLKLANDLKTILNRLVLLSRCVKHLKPFHLNRNRSRTRQVHRRDIINILLASFSRWYSRLRILAFPRRFMAKARSAVTKRYIFHQGI